jgi:hypothetical protein
MEIKISDLQKSNEMIPLYLGFDFLLKILDKPLLKKLSIKFFVVVANFSKESIYYSIMHV